MESEESSVTDMRNLPCPFSACSARVDLVEMRKHPDSSETMRMVPRHELSPNPEFGLCPASFMTVPLRSDAIKALRDQALVVDRFRRVANARQQRADADGPPRPRHRKAPQPERGSDRWFTSHTGDNPRNEPGPLGYQRSPLGVYPDTTDMGSSMATVAEVKAALKHAQREAAEAQDMIRQAAIKFTEAKALADWIRQASVDPIGTSALAGAIEACETAQALAGQAIDEQGQYGASL